MAVGDRWLFCLREENGKPIVLDYGNDSLPVANAKERIETLRGLETIGDRGILRGEVVRNPMGSWRPVADAQVVAQREAGNLRFVTTTDANGHYEFPPLPAGSYKITVRPVGSFRAEDSRVDVSGGSCWDVRLTRYPHAQIGGHVRYPNGSPVVGAQALLIHVDESMWSTRQVDANGYFGYEGLDAGRYVIGVLLTSPPPPDTDSDGTPPPASLYYPGAHNRSAAATIALRTDEKRDNIDITVPAP
jgi:Carboxypeptidase regulatory-like domain